jgi:hypothetical protein
MQQKGGAEKPGENWHINDLHVYQLVLMRRGG